MDGDARRIEYLRLDDIDPAALLPLLNKPRLREHLIDHPVFDAAGCAAWIASKTELDASPGCRVRAIAVDDRLVGWCGIQREGRRYEIALVLDDAHWGLGRGIFREMMCWARDLGHRTVFIHLLHTRPRYRFLQKVARDSYPSEIMGDRFMTYELAVD